MESVDSAWRDKTTGCNYKCPVLPTPVPQVCRVGFVFNIRHGTGQLIFVMRSRLSNCRLLVTVSCMITLPGSPSSRWQRLCHSPPWSRAASPPGSTWRRDEKWADRSRSQPVQRDEGDQGFKKALFCHTESSTAHPWNKQIFCQVCIVTEGQWLFQKNNNISPVLQTLND